MTQQLKQFRVRASPHLWRCWSRLFVGDTDQNQFRVHLKPNYTWIFVFAEDGPETTTYDGELLLVDGPEPTDASVFGRIDQWTLVLDRDDRWTLFMATSAVDQYHSRRANHLLLRMLCTQYAPESIHPDGSLPYEVVVH